MLPIFSKPGEASAAYAGGEVVEASAPEEGGHIPGGRGRITTARWCSWMGRITTGLEGRGPKMVLMGYIDDASSHFFGRFYDYEGVYPAMDSLERYIRRFGRPVSLYMDKHSTYKTTPHKAALSG